MFLSKHNKSACVVTGKIYAVPIGGIIADRMWQIAIVVIDILSHAGVFARPIFILYNRESRRAFFYFIVIILQLYIGGWLINFIVTS